MANSELVFPRLRDVDKKLQKEKKQGVDKSVEENVRRMVRAADKNGWHTETLPMNDGGVITLMGN